MGVEGLPPTAPLRGRRLVAGSRMTTTPSPSTSRREVGGWESNDYHPSPSTLRKEVGGWESDYHPSPSTPTREVGGWYPKDYHPSPSTPHSSFDSLLS